MYFLFSKHGFVLDSDKSIKDLVSRHHQHSKNPADVYLVEGGVKKFVQTI
jgi:hypothetical protein